MSHHTWKGLVCLSWLALAVANFYITFIRGEYLLGGKPDTDGDYALSIAIIIMCCVFAAVRGYRWLMREG